MPTKKPASATEWIDPEDAPRLDEDWFDRAAVYRGERLIRPGRPKSANPKQSVNLRLDADVLEFYRKSGPGWQTRMNDALRKAAGL